MNKRSIIVLALFLCLSCINKNSEEEKVVYDENGLKTFVWKLYAVSEAESAVRLDSLLQKASRDSLVFQKTVLFLEKPLGDPNSPYRDEILYTALLKAKINSPWYDSLTRAKVRDKLYVLMQNRVGGPANDFTFITAKGQQKKLYDVDANYIIIMFYNPECPACKDNIAALRNSPIINEKINTKELEVLALYIDRDLELWQEHLSELPQDWIVGHDVDEYLYKNGIYDVRAIPSLYLLDKDKKVLIKDASNIESVENYFK